ncbi:DoxX-like family protein [Psychrobacillus sp. OK032]|uniref:DoxX-like family protein n=1 Tax=Psychrobacillus sp. OK032 TaxID=1884358 RepID=UPI0008CAECCF|nr:DoxX-like family protein [Psychrobacillus sp. OK032]SES18504.1 DoxX-like family protein [Psychrobacillus sp. OK032]
MKRKSIYVETTINTEMEELWEATQKPEQHEQWDLRFSSITYLPKQENEPQHFEYKTNIGFGLNIAGWGKSVGTFHAEDGSRTSSLHFGTDQSISIIREGKGYWKYKPEPNSIKFLTQYDYETNFGAIGRFFDHLIFRPLIGWATALSFDVLKRWLEKGESPFTQYRRFFCHWMITFLFFFIWVYQGLIPKLVMMHPEEVRMTKNLLSITVSEASSLVTTIGMVEIIFGFIWLLYHHKKRLLTIQLILFPLLTLSAIIAEPAIVSHPFNPITFNIVLFVLSIIGYIMSSDIPSAKSCKRSR